MPAKMKSLLRVHSWSNEVGITFPPKFLEYLKRQIPKTCVDVDFSNDWTPWFTNFFYCPQKQTLRMDLVPVSHINQNRDYRLGFQAAAGFPKNSPQRILRLYRRNHGGKRPVEAVRFIPQFSIRDLEPSAIKYEPTGGHHCCGRVTINFGWGFTGLEDENGRLPDEAGYQETERGGIDPTVGLEDIKTAKMLTAGTVIGIHSADNRRLTTRRLTEGDMKELKRIFCRDD